MISLSPQVLATAPFGKEKKGEVGVERLVDEGVYTAAFPLHDVRYTWNHQIPVWPLPLYE